MAIWRRSFAGAGTCCDAALLQAAALVQIPQKHVPGMGLPPVNRRRPTTERKVQPKQGLHVNVGILRHRTPTLILLQIIQMQIWEKTTVEIQTCMTLGPGATQRIQLLDGTIASKLVQVQ